jgi:hypothetical protein
MMNMSCTIFFLLEGVEPIQATLWMCLIILPEAFGILWGVFAESVNIFGMQQRGHLLLSSLLQFICSVIIIAK